MGKIIAIFNRKGGVAKTTSTYNLAALSAMKGYKTLMVDLDSQASLTISTGKDAVQFEYDIANLLEDKINKVKKSNVNNAIYPVEQIDNLYLIPSSTRLSFLESSLSNITAREYVLKRILDKISDNYDYIFIDCAPSLGNLNINALSASDYVIIPTEADYLAYKGVNELMPTIEEVKELINDKLEVLGVVITKFEGNINDSNMVLEFIEKKHKVLGIVKKSITIKKGIYAGIPLVVKPENKIAREIKEEYEKIFNYIENTGGDQSE